MWWQSYEWAAVDSRPRHYSPKISCMSKLSSDFRNSFVPKIANVMIINDIKCSR